MEYTYMVVAYSSGVAVVQMKFDKLSEAVDAFHMLQNSLVNYASADVIAYNRDNMSERIGKLLK